MKKLIKKIKLAIHILRMPSNTCLQLDKIQEYLYQLYALDELYYNKVLGEQQRQLFNLRVAEIKFNIQNEINDLVYD